ncbi:MAG: hypothetical protein HUN05_11210 [Desulfobacter sp.]|nr:MAG: hypothetical protein HUN05_11210 [Desulfobacter sp.]
MTVVQTRHIATAQRKDTETTPQASSSLGETLAYLFPDHLRSDTDSGKRFYVQSPDGFVSVLDGVVTDVEKSILTYYTDPLIYRDSEILLRQLGLAGIHVEDVSIERFDGQICYFIGQRDSAQDSGPGLWIEKDHFFPVRYLVKKNNRVIDARYGNWQRVSKTWYPMETRIFVDQQLFVTISVARCELKSGFLKSLFNVDQILSKYPKKTEAVQSDTGHRDRIEDLDKEIEDFSKLYD